jgi:hypothetical protein
MSEVDERRFGQNDGVSQPTPSDRQEYSLPEGLLQYYSSQAALLLSQYENINQLLGPTDDWTGPGTHCEVLLRSFFRRFVPSFLSVNKGFIYGRMQRNGQDVHCPEIDVLIHDTLHFSPILQVDDFVIVQGVSAEAAVQVKRAMDTGKLEEAIENVVNAREHFAWHCRPRASPPFFSAVVFFEEKCPRKDGQFSTTYENCIHRRFSDPATWRVAPDFIGSLKHHVFYRQKYGPDLLQYIGVPSLYDGHNIGLQILLWKLSNAIGRTGCNLPFAFPQVDKSRSVVIDIRRHEPSATQTEPQGPAS